MTTYAAFIALSPLAKGQDVFNAGVVEGLRRAKDSLPAVGLYTRDDVQSWRNDVAEAAAVIVGRFVPDNESTHLVNAIMNLRSMPYGKSTFEPRYDTKRMLPVCNMEPSSFGVPVLVWLEEVKDGVPAFYGMRSNDPSNQIPQFYYAGAPLKGVTHWQYREADKA